MVSGVPGKIKVGAVTPPASLDWRTPKAVTSIKNQGQCGDCWSFSTTAYVESQFIMKSNTTYDLSQQFLLECTGVNSSCSGGYVDDAMTLAKQTGMNLQTKFPYTSSNLLSGHPNPTTTGICTDFSSIVQLPTGLTTVNSHYNAVTPNSGITLDAIKQLLMEGPIPALVYANTGFQTYSNGTFYCSTATTLSNINHAVQLVGYTANN